MRIYKNGSVIFTSIDNTGSTDEASLGARYAKGRLDSTWNNLTQNYYTKDQVTTLIEQALNDANLLQAMVVPTVPPTSAASPNIIYLVPVTGSDNVYQQYKKVLVSQDPDEYTMALLGSTEVELQDIQVAALPTPTAEQANKVLQYIGEATTRTRGRFYWCAPKNYYAWDLSTDATQTFYVENNPPRPGDNIFTGRTESGEFIVTVVSQVATVPDSAHMTDTNGMTMLRNTVKDVVGYSWIALFSKLSEFDNDGNGSSPFVTEAGVQTLVDEAVEEATLRLGVFVATVDSTTELELKEAIGDRREILLTTGDNQPYYTVVYTEDKGADGAYIVVSGIVTDTARWNRKRSSFTAYTVRGNLWTATDPIDALIAEDLTNIVTSLPSTGVANTRYLLKVTDASAAGYHLEEYIYTDGKWACISKEQPAPFIATINETSQAEIKAAIDARSPIYVYSGDTGVLRPATSASANLSTAFIQYLLLSGTSGDYAVDIVSYSVTGTTWTSTHVGIATKENLNKYVHKLAAPIASSTTNYIRAFKMNADGLVTGTSGTYTKSDTISSSSTTSQLPSAKAVRDYVATPSKVTLTYNSSYINQNYSTCYKIAEKIYMCNIAFQTAASDVPSGTWLIRFPENIASNGVEVYCVLHCTDRVNVPATLLLQMGGSASFNQFFVKTNPIPGNKYYFGNAIIIKTA